MTKPNEIVSLLLNDDELANLDKQGTEGLDSTNYNPQAMKGIGAKDVGADEDDDFFGTGGNLANENSAAIVEVGDEDENGAPVTVSARGKKRASRGGRKPGPKRGYKRKAAGSVE